MKTKESVIAIKYRMCRCSDTEKNEIDALLKQLYLAVQEEQKDPELSGLEVSYSITISSPDKNKPAFDVTSNKHYSLSGSYALVSFIEDWLNENKVFRQLCLNSSFEFDVHFKLKKEQTGQHEVDRQEEGKTEEQESVFKPQKGRYTFDQLILNDQVYHEILDGLAIIKHADLIFKEWGFDEIEPSPRSIMNFYGPPGTGKSMCAEAIAHHLNKPLIKLNYAEIESKYVGEAAKNMMSAFASAVQHDAILFFDEADSFLGKRIQNVTHGSEQALNSLRSQTLILLEDFKGIVLFATNLVTNYDKAFESRILKHIHFELPDDESRKKIILSKIPSRIPMKENLQDSDLQCLSDISEGFSGREIKNAICEMLSSKAREECVNAMFTVADFCAAFERKKAATEALRQMSPDAKNRIIQAMERKASEAV